MLKLAKINIPSGIMKLAGGAGAAQVIAALGMPVLSRIYTPADFGVLGVFMATVTVAAVFVTGRYEAAIPLPDRDGEAWSLLKLALYLTILTQAALALLLLFWLPAVWQPLGRLIWLLPAGIMIMTVITATEFWLNRKGMFGPVAKSRVAGAAVLLAAQILFGLAGLGGGGLLLGFVLGLLATAAINLGKSIKTRPAEAAGVPEAARRYARFPRYLLAAQVFNSGANHLPTLALGAYFGTAAAGLYAMGNRALAVLDMISTAAGQVFYPRAARQYNDAGECRDLYGKTARGLGVAALAVFPLTCLALPDVFGFVLGREWRGAGELARWLCPMFFMRFIVSPVSALFYIAGRQHLYLYRQVLLFALVLAGLYAGVRCQSVFVAVGLYSLSYVVSYLIDGIVSFNLAGGNKKNQESEVRSQKSEVKSWNENPPDYAEF
ncbi:MAG: colanic acid exporter [Pelotomaculum sp. PtaU1.Bin065]|nr:MAG: colanic acid exporter [Pelotomaculum sp. PtaU1.Bin065]